MDCPAIAHPEGIGPGPEGAAHPEHGGLVRMVVGVRVGTVIVIMGVPVGTVIVIMGVPSGP